MCGKMLRIGRQNNSTTIQSRNTMPCIDDHQFREEEMGFLGELSKVVPYGNEQSEEVLVSVSKDALDVPMPLLKEQLVEVPDFVFQDRTQQWTFE